MATRRAGDVFLNVPFASSHESIYIALIAGLAALRLNPRSVLEIPPQQSRLDIHRGNADGVLEALLDVFSDLPESPDVVDLRRLYRHLRQFRQDRLGQDVFKPKPFSKLLVAARELSK